MAEKYDKFGHTTRSYQNRLQVIVDAVEPGIRVVVHRLDVTRSRPTNPRLPNRVMTDNEFVLVAVVTASNTETCSMEFYMFKMPPPRAIDRSSKPVSDRPSKPVPRGTGFAFAENLSIVQHPVHDELTTESIQRLSELLSKSKLQEQKELARANENSQTQGLPEEDGKTTVDAFKKKVGKVTINPEEDWWDSLLDMSDDGPGQADRFGASEANAERRNYAVKKAIAASKKARPTAARAPDQLTRRQGTSGETGAPASFRPMGAEAREEQTARSEDEGKAVVNRLQQTNKDLLQLVEQQAAEREAQEEEAEASEEREKKLSKRLTRTHRALQELVEELRNSTQRLNTCEAEKEELRGKVKRLEEAHAELLNEFKTQTTEAQNSLEQMMKDAKKKS